MFGFFILAGLIIFFAPQSLTSKLQLAFFRVFNKPLSISRNFTLAASNRQSLSTVAERNRYIRLRNLLANNIQWLRQERQKVEELSGLRNRSVWKDVNFVLADVITAFADGLHSEFVINRGKNDGLAEGQFVLDQCSIIGTISALDSRTARVRLVTDPKSKIVVKIAELNVGAIMQGNGDNSAKILLLPIEYKIKIGDIVYVQKHPGFLDTSMIVATVSQCKRDDENPLLWDITAKPACDIQRLKRVTVIIMNSQELGQENSDCKAFCFPRLKVD